MCLKSLFFLNRDFKKLGCSSAGHLSSFYQYVEFPLGASISIPWKVKTLGHFGRTSGGGGNGWLVHSPPPHCFWVSVVSVDQLNPCVWINQIWQLKNTLLAFKDRNWQQGGWKRPSGKMRNTWSTDWSLAVHLIINCKNARDSLEKSSPTGALQVCCILILILLTQGFIEDIWST